MAHADRAPATPRPPRASSPTSRAPTGTTRRSGSSGVKRDRAAAQVPEWEALRERRRRASRHTPCANLAGLPRAVRARTPPPRGATVHWARDADEHNRDRPPDPAAERGVTPPGQVQVDAHRGVRPQPVPRGARHRGGRHRPRRADRPARATSRPSHIVLPAIHIKKEEIGELFHRTLGTAAGASDPTYLTEAARGHLREKFLAAQAGLTGVNFAVAETGGVVVCTNEGNADMGTSLPPLHIACMGMEKIVPRAEDLAVFLRLLARSATGQPITTYTTHFHGPMPRRRAARRARRQRPQRACSADETFRGALACIRCGACMNTCPVFRRSGGHSYGVDRPRPHRLGAGPGPRPGGPRLPALRLHASAAPAPTSARCASTSTTSSWPGGGSSWPRPAHVPPRQAAGACAWPPGCSARRARYELAGPAGPARPAPAARAGSCTAGWNAWGRQRELPRGARRELPRRWRNRGTAMAAA